MPKTVYLRASIELLFVIFRGVSIIGVANLTEILLSCHVESLIVYNTERITHMSMSYSFSIVVWVILIPHDSWAWQVQILKNSTPLQWQPLDHWHRNMSLPMTCSCQWHGHEEVPFSIKSNCKTKLVTQLNDLIIASNIKPKLIKQYTNLYTFLLNLTCANTYFFLLLPLLLFLLVPLLLFLLVPPILIKANVTKVRCSRPPLPLSNVFQLTPPTVSNASLVTY